MFRNTLEGQAAAFQRKSGLNRQSVRSRGRVSAKVSRFVRGGSVRDSGQDGQAGVQTSSLLTSAEPCVI